MRRLRWMQDKGSPGVVMASADAVHAMPSELLRKGGFDEVFFIDLPDREQREAIWRIHLERRADAARDPGLMKRVDVEALAGLSEGYSGGEMASAVIEGAFEALARREPLTNAHIFRALSASPPMSKARADVIRRVRDWARDRARRAG